MFWCILSGTFCTCPCQKNVEFSTGSDDLVDIEDLLLGYSEYSVRIMRLVSFFTVLLSFKGGSTGGGGGDRPLDGCWPKNRDARPIKSRFYQSQNALKLAFLELKNRKNFLGRGLSPDTSPVGRGHTLPTFIGVSMFDSTHAFGTRPRRLCPRRLHSPPSHTFWIRPWLCLRLRSRRAGGTGHRQCVITVVIPTASVDDQR